MNNSDDHPMSSKADQHDLVQFLSDDPEPLWLLEHLRDEPSTLEEISDDLSVSQLSLQPSLDELTERQWAEQTSDGYRITTLGAFVTMEYLAFLDTLEQITASEQFIQELPLEAISPIHPGSHTTVPTDVYDNSSL
jgi:predicted transcriptional regulator